MNFYILMDGRYYEGSYALPHRIATSAPKLFIAARIGDEAERICICILREQLDASRRAPVAVTVDFTLTGVLARRNDVAGCETFLLDRTVPTNIAVEGRFQPSDGYALISYRADGPELEAVGRFAPVAAFVQADAPDMGNSWQIRARRLPWPGEILT